MNTVNNSIYNWLNNSIAGGSPFADSGMGGIGGVDFSELLAGLSGKGGSGADSAGSLLDYLSRRYPDANFSEGTVGETPADVQDYFGSEEGDNVAVDAAAAEAVASNPALAKTLEGVLDALKESMGSTRSVDGARVQRNVMVTSITIRFSVSQISNETGETLSSNELKTAFSEMADMMKEMAMKFFGQTDTGNSGNPGSEGNEDIDIFAEEGKNGSGSFFGMNFSFSMYASQSLHRLEEDAYAMNGEQDFNLADKFRYKGNFQNSMMSTLSYAMSYGGGMGSGPFTSLLNSGMDMFGMSPSGMWQQGAGFNFQFGAAGKGGGLSDLMAMLTSLANNSTALTPPAAPAAPVEAEPEPAPAEAAAVA